MQFERIPAELRNLHQWCVAGASKAPMSANLSTGELFNVKVTEPHTWMDFQTACNVANFFKNHVTTHTDRKGKVTTQTGLNIGFVLHESDPYACIDLDVKDAENAPDDPESWTTPEQFDLFYRIMLNFDSYTESSRSGKGLHVWVRGNIGPGCRRDGVEVYSQERFIICTGNIVQDKPIREQQAMLENMVSQMRPKEKKGVAELIDSPDEEDDWSILLRAVNARNSQKFCSLWSGKWQEMNFPSQSEADLALMSILAFYSKSNEQCRRLFRESGLGQREKAQKNNRHLNLMLSMIRDREARERAIEANILATSAQAVAQLGGERELAAMELQRLQGGATTPSRVTLPLHVEQQGNPQQSPQPTAVAATLAGPVPENIVQAGSVGLPWPPGLAGKIAQFIYQSAPKPVKEVAIVGALGLLAGICGKAWHIPQSGLNMYIILIARSGVGKEAMHSGISMLIRACTMKYPTFPKFVDFSDYASGPALTKACAANPSFVNVSGEWGRKLKRLASDDGRDGPIQTLRTVMTNLYQKSGPQSIVGGIGYSNKDNNIASVNGVAYSMVGETTPGTFYQSLTESMMEDGFLSRFVIIEYDGKRPESNTRQMTVPDKALEDALINLARQADTIMSTMNGPGSCVLNRTEEAALLMRNFEHECDSQINSHEEESVRQMWNRAALKVLRMSGLLAVADNCIHPCITKEHFEWALDVVRRDITIMSKRLESGDVGNTDSSRERKLFSIIREYFEKPLPASYKVPKGMRENELIPLSYLTARLSNVSIFYNHKAGSSVAINNAIRSAVNDGYLMQVDKLKMAEAYNYHGLTYRLLRIPDHHAK